MPYRITFFLDKNERGSIPLISWQANGWHLENILYIFVVTIGSLRALDACSVGSNPTIPTSVLLIYVCYRTNAQEV